MPDNTDIPRDDTACLHCEINQLVQERIDHGDTNVAELASMIVESLAEVILLAPENEQSKLVAEMLAHFGQSFLEKSGAVPPTGATH